MMTADETRFYTGHSLESDPSNLGRLLDPMPGDAQGILSAVGRLVLHRAFVEPAGIACPAESLDDFESRNMPEMLRRILARDPAPLVAGRPPEKRLIGVCRHYALLACSIFRHHGRPARLRVGFADYFEPGFYDDHWVTEYWDGRSWRLMDPELTANVCRHFQVSFDPCHVPRDRFLTAGAAWLGVRSGLIDSSRCGVSSLSLTGYWFVASSVVRDLAALNKREMLPWDYWGIVRDMQPGTSIAESTAARLDALAHLIAHPHPAWNSIRGIYEKEEAFKVPPLVLSFPKGAPVEVAVGGCGEEETGPVPS
jgi:Transglutaminase-like superfamily